MHKFSLNQVVLIGRIGQDPEIRATTSGTTVANISIATTISRKQAFTEDQYSEETEWHRCVAFGKIAEHIQRYGTKGRLCNVVGRLQTKKWQDQNNATHYTTSVIIETFTFLDKKEQAGSQPGSYSGGFSQQANAPVAAQPAAPALPDNEDDLPF